MAAVLDIKSDRRSTNRQTRLITLSLTYLPTQCSSYAVESFRVVSTNVSTAGAFLSIPQGAMPPKGAKVTLEPSGGDEHLRIEASVIRTVHKPSFLHGVRGIGIAFTRVTSEDGAAVLHKWLATVSSPDRLPSLSPKIMEHASGDVSYCPSVNARVLPLSVHSARISPTRSVPDELKTYEKTVHAIRQGHNRRRFSRQPCSLAVRWTVDELPNAGTLLNASRSGVFIQTDHELPAIGTTLAIEFRMMDRQVESKIRLVGRVRRHWKPGVEGLPGYGLKITRVEEHGRTGSYWMFLRRMSGRTGGPRRGYRYSPKL